MPSGSIISTLKSQVIESRTMTSKLKHLNQQTKFGRSGSDQNSDSECSQCSAIMCVGVKAQESIEQRLKKP